MWLANVLFLLRDKATFTCKQTQIVEAILKLLGHRSFTATSAHLEDKDLEMLALARGNKV